MPYATDNKISKAPIDGAVEITDEQYREALQAQLQGKKVAVRGGSLRILSREKKTVYSTEDKSKLEILENDDIQDGYTDLEPGEFDEWNGSEWIENTEAKEQAEKEKRNAKIDRELDVIDKAAIRAIRAERAANAKGKKADQKDLDRLVELEDAAGKLREQRDGSGEIDWPKWRK